jgi:hypothetical protein
MLRQHPVSVFLHLLTDDVPLNNKFKVVVDKYLDIPAGIAVAPSDE